MKDFYRCRFILGCRKKEANSFQDWALKRGQAKHGEWSIILKDLTSHLTTKHQMNLSTGSNNKGQYGLTLITKFFSFRLALKWGAIQGQVNFK